MNAIETPELAPECSELSTVEQTVALLGADEFAETKPYVYGVVFGGVTLMHDPSLSAEILESRAIAAIPNTVSWFVGMINVRGSLVPVFDLALLITAKAPKARRDRRRIMVIGNAGRSAGLLIDQLPQRTDLDALLEAPDSSIPEILEVARVETYQVGEATWVEVDFEKLFALLGESVLERDERPENND